MAGNNRPRNRVDHDGLAVTIIDRKTVADAMRPSLPERAPAHHVNMTQNPPFEAFIG